MKYPEKRITGHGANLTFCVMCSITVAAEEAVEQAAFIYMGYSLCYTHFSIEYNKQEESKKDALVEGKVANAVEEATSDHYSAQNSPNFYRQRMGLSIYTAPRTYQIETQHPGTDLIDIVHYEAALPSELFDFVGNLLRTTRTELLMITMVPDSGEDVKGEPEEREEAKDEPEATYATFDFGYPLLTDIVQYERIQQSDSHKISVNRIRFLRSEMEQTRRERGYSVGSEMATWYRTGYRLELLKDLLYRNFFPEDPPETGLYAQAAFKLGREDGAEARHKAGL